MAPSASFFKINVAFRIGGRMYGVVLWNDHDQGRAVIWCEDHGNLAFFNGETDAQTAHLPDGLEPGDLVQFDMNESKRMRLAHNLTLVAPDEYPSLADDLREAGKSSGRPEPRHAVATPSNIIPFGLRLSRPGPATERARNAG